uniref:glutathione transferase n=1 Tax=Lissorhoptrus oryzophilus TaxID=308863 RepID=A0A2R4FXE6_9CUCU|nr:glutathione S-transferase t1 [Lissorhoptrus oryzophilus]
MPQLKYYYDFMSQPSRALYIFLKLTNIPFEVCPVALRKGIQHSDEFKEKLNRFQKVPFIHHGSFKLAESIAIVRYLSREYRDVVEDHWYPKNSQEQAKVDEYLEWQHTNTRLHCASYFVYKWLIPNMTQSPPDANEVSKHESNMLTCLDQIEDLWLGQGHKYIVGDKISVADIFAATELEQPKMAGFDVCKGRPKLKAWLDQVKQDCSPFYEEAHVITNKIASQAKRAKL